MCKSGSGEFGLAAEVEVSSGTQASDDGVDGLHPAGDYQGGKIVWKASELDILEEAITKLYSQEFYDRFRRAPIVPRRLSHAARTIAPIRHADEPRVLDPWPLHYYDLSMFSVRK
jgi:hypothetical protein